MAPRQTRTLATPHGAASVMWFCTRGGRSLHQLHPAPPALPPLRPRCAVEVGSWTMLSAPLLVSVVSQGKIRCFRFPPLIAGVGAGPSALSSTATQLPAPSTAELGRSGGGLNPCSRQDRARVLVIATSRLDATSIAPASLVRSPSPPSLMASASTVFPRRTTTPLAGGPFRCFHLTIWLRFASAPAPHPWTAQLSVDAAMVSVP